MNRVASLLAKVLLSINGVGALIGGAALVLDPTGALLHLPIQHLEYSPFDSYLIPGIVLFLANGLLSLLVLVAVVREWGSAGVMVLGQGVVLSLWIIAQIHFLRMFYVPMHAPFMLIGLLLALSGYCMWCAMPEKVDSE